MKHVYLIGIGGVGMSAIATLLLKKGMSVSGSDTKYSQVIRNLEYAGASIYIGHSRKNLQDTVDVVVYSSAIKKDNPEIREAQKRRLKIYRRAEMLYLLMHGKRVITVTGAHGKTTTASLIAYILFSVGLSPTVAIGGHIKNFSRNAWMGEGDYFVAEADESDGTFLQFSSKFSVITNIDKEHLDYYGDFSSLVNSFSEFINRLEHGGTLFINYSDKNLYNLAKVSREAFKTFGLDKGADIWADNIREFELSCEFDCFLKTKKVGRVSLPLIGRHNIVNCLAAIILSLELNIDFGKITKAIQNYKGLERRLEVKFKNPNFLVIDDYAHHPTEIEATLIALKENLKATNSYQKIIAVFQPHRYSRTKLLLSEFARSLSSSEHLIITDIYPASEKPIAGVDARRLYEEIMRAHTYKNDVYYLEKKDIISHILKRLSGNEVVLFLGAGDITKIADEFAERIKTI